MPQLNVGGAVETDYQTKSSGRASLRLSASSAQTPVGIVSHEFAAPETGRLDISLKYRTTDGQPLPPMILRLESSNENYQPFHLFDRAISDEFKERQLSFVDLPTEQDLRLRIRIDLVGKGEVWIDDIQLYDKWIVKDEKKVLQKIIQRAVHQQGNGDLAACFDTLSSYWPRFLLRHVPPAEVATRPVPQPLPKSAPQKKNSKLFDLRRFVPRLR